MSARSSKPSETNGAERRIEIDAEGFTVVDAAAAESARCDWARVREVFAYKIDLFSYDEICVGFRFDETGNQCSVAESDTGYAALLAVLPQRFPGIRVDWFEEVSRPAFATNRTRLWGESAVIAPMTPEARRRELVRGEVNYRIHWGAEEDDVRAFLHDGYGIDGAEADALIADALAARRREIRLKAEIGLVVALAGLGVSAVYFAIQVKVGFVVIGLGPILMGGLGLSSMAMVGRCAYRLFTGETSGPA